MNDALQDAGLNDSEPSRTNATLRLGALYARIVAHAERSAAAREAQIEAALAFWYEGFVADAIDRFVESDSNSLTPGRRPRTTLTPSMAFRNGRPYLAFGTPGGDQQEQWSLQFFLRHVDHAMPMQQAIDAPSFRTNHVVNSFWPREIEPGSLVLEDRFPDETIRELSRREHRVSVGGRQTLSVTSGVHSSPWQGTRVEMTAMSICPLATASHKFALVFCTRLSDASG